MTYTSIEQSNKLLELGLPKQTADLSYEYVKYDGISEPQYPLAMHKPKSKDIPCWSAEALLELLPENVCDEEGDEYNLNICKESDTSYNIQYVDYCENIEDQCWWGEELLELLYNAVVWLLENKMI